MERSEFEQAANYWMAKEDDAVRMPENELRKEVNEFLSAHDTCALACGTGTFVRCTPLEYAFREGAFWIFSEGGLKFFALERNENVSLAVYEPYGGFGKLRSVQVTGIAAIVDPNSDEFARAAEAKGIVGPSLERVKGMLHLIKVTPSRIDYLSSDLKQYGYDARQWIE